jgi:hypothetical protein
MSLQPQDRLGPSGLPLQPALCSTRFAFGPTKSRNIDSEAGSNRFAGQQAALLSTPHQVQ